MDSIAFPIRFSNNELKKLTQDSDDYFNQAISVLVQTVPGEMPLDPGFGVKSMEFTKPRSSIIQRAIESYYPEIAIKKIELRQDVNTQNYNIRISYVR